MNKRNFFWNMMGSGIYSLSVVVFVMLAKRLAGEEAGADFYMAFTTGQMLLTIGYFEIRPFQVTDVTRQYKPEDYFGFRVITSGIMMLAAFLVAAFYFGCGRTGGAGVVLIILVCFIKMLDGLGDVFEGEFQRMDRIDISGMSMCFRTVAVLGTFSVAAAVTHNIYIASFASAVAGSIFVVAFAVYWHVKFEPFKVCFDGAKLRKLFDSTILLFIASAMCMWIWNGTKYIVEWNLTSLETLVYGVVFMPTMVINLCSGFVFKPMLTTMARYYGQKDKKGFYKIMWIMVASVVVITIATLLVSPIIRYVLEFVYDLELKTYYRAMLILITAGGLNAMSIVFYYTLMVMRRQKMIFAGYTISFVSSVVVPLILIPAHGITGAAYSYLLTMVILTAVFAFMTYIGE